MNEILWHVKIVDPYSPELVDRTGRLTVATTNPENNCMCISSDLRGDFKMTVLIHELGHCAMFSFGMLDYIHERVPKEYWIDMEEFICNFIADYGFKIFKTAYRLFGEDAIRFVPGEIEKLIA